MKTLTAVLSTVLSTTLLATLAPAQVVNTVVSNGPPSELYDMVFLGDGYTAADQARFDQDVLDVITYYRNTPNKFPYGAYFHLYNVHTVFRASNQRGADKPPLNIFVDTAYDASYWTGGTERCLYIHNRGLAAADAALAPDTDGRVIVLVNDSKYGGCAGTFSVSYNGSVMEDVQAHEWGHSFGGLADEYSYGQSGTYSGGEPGTPNITADPTGVTKWGAWLGHQGPHGVVAAYQGAGYYQYGLYRPEPDCEMRSLNRNFCTVCREAMIKRFHQECVMFAQPTPSPIATPRGSSVQVSFVNRLATRPHTIEWRVDGGTWQAGGTSFTWSVGNAWAGRHTIEARLTDTSTEVRQDPAGYLVHVHAWQADVPATRFDLGITEVIPGSAEGDTDSAYPWNSTTGMRAMYAYGTSGSPLHVLGVRFRPDGAVTSLPGATWDLALDVSTGRNAPAALDRTFDQNHGADRVRAFDGTVTALAQGLGTAPHPFTLVVPFDEPFAWNPRSGPLLLDFRLRGLTSGAGVRTDAATATAGEFARIVHTGDPNATVANFPASGSQPIALVAELVLDAEVSPASSALIEGPQATLVGLGYGAAQRLMTIHDGPTFGSGGRHRIAELAWRLDTGQAWSGNHAIDVRVELSTGPIGLAATATRTFDQNHGADRAVVFDGVWTPPATAASGIAPFALRLELDQPFEFDPSRASLVVDMQFRGISNNPMTAVDADAPSTGVRTLWTYGASNPVSALLDQVTTPILALVAIPTPVLPESADGTPGGITLSRPWGAPGAGRSMTAYDAAALGAAEAVEITHLSWRVAGSAPTPPTTWRARIDLSSGGSLPLGTNFDNNHGADRATVFQGDFSAARGGDGEFVVEVKLDTPFRWDPTNGPLVVDVRKDAELGGGGTIALDAAASAQLSFAAHTTDPNATTPDRPIAAKGQVLRLGGSVGANALVTPYGTGCPGASGTPIASSVGTPWIGNRDFAFAVFDARPNASASILFGLNATNTPLGPFGAPGCTLLSDALFGIVPLPTDAAGAARSPASVPSDPSLVGAQAHVQWAVLDPAGSGGLAMSDGLRIEVR